MTAAFPITRDDEFYALLKSSLPAGYRIEAEPRTAYYSQWLFCYKFYHDDKLLRTYSGDFRNIPAGSMVQEAEALFERIEGGI